VLGCCCFDDLCSAEQQEAAEGFSADICAKLQHRQRSQLVTASCGLDDLCSAATASSRVQSFYQCGAASDLMQEVGSQAIGGQADTCLLQLDFYL
jgi:hypothetical protein